MKWASFVLPVAASAALGIAACGSVAGVQQAAGSGGSSPTSSSTTATGAGGTSATCAGKAGTPCGPDQYCHFGPSSPCGNFDAPGTCEPRPEACDADCPGVCGCDGKFYCNACGANAAGVDVSPETACMGPDTYTALSLFTNVPRYAILKASPQRNLCFRLDVVALGGGGQGIPGLTGNVTVDSALITHDAADCEVSGAPLPMPAGPTYPVVSGMGAVSMAMTPSGCTTTIAAKVTFSGAAPWVPPSEMLDASGLTIVGGCP